jgi:two-component system, NtrC family, sensor histidine kinase HydH
MLQQGDTQAPDTLEHSQDITQAVDRADRWITELVRVSQAPNLAVESVSIAPLIRDCLQEMQAELQRNNIRVVAQTEPALHVQAHAAMLRQMVLSIIANAMDAMGKNGQLNVSWQTTGASVLLKLADNGPGISDEVQQRIFRPFFSTKSGGLGIGLALVKRTVEQWKGSIHLQPVVPHGTSVEIRLPLAQ